MSRLALLAITLILTCSLAVACGGGDEELSPTPPPEEEDAAEIPSLLDLEGTLLTADELPAGWIVEEESGWVSDWEDWVENEPYDVCAGVEMTIPAEPIDTAFTAYTHEDTAPSPGPIFHEIGSFPEGKGKEVMAFYSQAADKCDGVTETLEDGTELTYQFSSFSFPKLGDETLAFRWQLVYDGDGEAQEPGAYVLIRQDDVSIALSMPSDFDSEVLEQIARLAYEKLKGLE